MNFFSSLRFLLPLAETHHPGKAAQLEDFSVEGKTFRLLTLDGAPLTQHPFLDFVEPLSPGEDRGEAPRRQLGYLPTASLETVSGAAYSASLGRMPSPFIEWGRFESHAAYVEALPRRGASSRKLQAIEKEFGAVDFQDDDRREEVFRTALTWKSSQYRATGFVDQFANPEHVALFERLRGEGTLRVASLSAGGRLLAVHLGVLDERRLYSWIPAYDAATAKFSPGRVLLGMVMQASFARGDREFDFLIGDESYKWDYATGFRVIGELGQVPLRLRMERQAKRTIKGALQTVPGMWDAVSTLRRRLA